LSHYHGQVWNASRVAAALGLSDKTVRSYLDLLTKSMSIALESLRLDKLLIVYPGDEAWPVSEQITACPLHKVRESLG